MLHGDGGRATLREHYLPDNAPAVGDLFGLFDFGEEGRGQDGE